MEWTLAHHHLVVNDLSEVQWPLLTTGHLEVRDLEWPIAWPHGIVLLVWWTLINSHCFFSICFWSVLSVHLVQLKWKSEWSNTISAIFYLSILCVELWFLHISANTTDNTLCAIKQSCITLEQICVACVTLQKIIILKFLL